MNTRTSPARIGAVALLSALATLLTAQTGSASPVVDGFDVTFVDGSCGPGSDAAAALHVQFTDNVMPDGSVHHWIDLRGTIANEDAGKVVMLTATRRFTDSATGETSTFRGLQGQFSAAGAGVLAHTSGWSDGSIVQGRWDSTPTNALPPEVCTYLFG